MLRVAVDTGGTFTDLVVDDDGQIDVFKTSTSPDDPAAGVEAGLRLAAEARGQALADFLGRTDLLIHGTTRALNAVLTDATARTAFFTTAGHRDILLFREGGRTDPFRHDRSFPKPYVPRSLTFEIEERIGSEGEVVKPLDEESVMSALESCRERDAEAIAVCLIWSVVNPDHEQRIGELIAESLPGVPHTLSHRLNPIVREYRRASSTAIDASLKPLMSVYIGGFEDRLMRLGFAGRLLIISSNGGVMSPAQALAAPVQLLNSGPSMAPVAGRFFADFDLQADTAIVADTGGTSYDVSLVRRGEIPRTTETWIGEPYLGHMTGFPSVDVQSIGAGGGSIARVDKGGLLHVGPESAGSQPGPACYGRGGEEPTVTDAALVLGYIDPAYFLGGRLPLHQERAYEALGQVARPLGRSEQAAAAAILDLASEQMVRAIEDVTINQGVDPAGSILVAGGGAAGLNAVTVAKRLGCRSVLIPPVGAVLSASGALLSELSAEYAATLFTTSEHFKFAEVSELLEELRESCRSFETVAGSDTTVELFAEARYPHQIWEVEVPITNEDLGQPVGVEDLRQTFHRRHQELFAISDVRSPVEFVGWRARASSKLAPVRFDAMSNGSAAPEGVRPVYTSGEGKCEASVWRAEAVPCDSVIEGLAIIESDFTTIVVDRGAVARRSDSGGTLVDFR